MNTLFSHTGLIEIHGQLTRNIVSVSPSQDLFDDLSSSPQDWQMAQTIEDEIKPPPYQSFTPIIHRPFEDAHWFNAITWPFKHWQSSRFSDGSFGVWYGCDSAETSVYETVYHWHRKFLFDAGFDNETVIAHRKVYEVECHSALIDLRPMIAEHSELMHKSDYHFAQSIGLRLHREGHPGLVTKSVRRAVGVNYAILNSQVLSNPTFKCQVKYILNKNHVIVEKQAGTTWLEIPFNAF